MQQAVQVFRERVEVDQKEESWLKKKKKKKNKLDSVVIEMREGFGLPSFVFYLWNSAWRYEKKQFWMLNAFLGFQ